MFWRFFSFATVQLLCVLVVWVLAAEPAPGWYLWGSALVGCYLWTAWDALRGLRFLRWLRAPDRLDHAFGNGLWAEVFDRTRRLLRTRERSVTESDNRLQDFLAALQASPNGVVLLDADGRIEWFNHTAANHFGFDALRDMLQHFGNLVRDPAFAAYYAARDFQGDVVMFGRTHSNSKPVKLSVNMHPYGEGRSLVLSRDITLVEQADAMRRDFVANVSHEIRTPLTVLSGFVQTLQTLPLGAQEQQHYLSLMAVQAQHMETLVQDLLTLSRLEGSAPPPQEEWVSMAALMAQCMQDANSLSQVLWSQPQTLRFEVAPGLDIAGAASELHSAMFNLIGNAIRYTPVDKDITVRWSLQPEGQAVFAVKDEGIGIAHEHIARLTERFYRVDRSRSRETGGTGLGLAIVKHVAQRHGAELLIDSTPGKGSTFSLVFPPSRIRKAAPPELLAQEAQDTPDA